MAARSGGSDPFDQAGFDYFDASDDSMAWRDANLPQILEHDLVLAGFKPLGCVRAVMRNGRMELIDQVWVGDGGRIMVTAGNGAELATLFEDGSVVKTYTVGGRAGFVENFRLRRHPRDRHDFLRVGGEIDVVRARHIERIARFEADSPVVLAGSMLPYLAMRIRTGELIVAAARRRRDIAQLITVAAMALAAVLVFSWQARLHHHPHPGVVLLVLLAMFIAGIPAAYLSGDWVAPPLARLRPGPPPRPAKVLLELAANIKPPPPKSPKPGR